MTEINKNMIEHLSRKLCELQKIDPDKIGYGMGVMMPKDTEYPLWHVQSIYVKTILNELIDIGMIKTYTVIGY